MTTTYKHNLTSAALVLFVLAVLASPALAHHILGIPHYAYDEDYPQTPILTYKQNFGPHEITMTGYPGKPTPGEQCAYNVYITRLDNGEPFTGTVTLTVFKDNLLGADPIIYGPSDAELDQAVYKFHPRFEAEANYMARIEFFAEDAPWIIDLPVVVGAKVRIDNAARGQSDQQIGQAVAVNIPYDQTCGCRN